METNEEEDLDKTFQEIIFLIYRNRCIWHTNNEKKCEGRLRILNLIPGNSLFRWDMNSNVCVCEKHKEWYESGEKQPYELLFQTLPSVANFCLINQDDRRVIEHQINDFKAFLLDNFKDAVRKKKAPFPSLYGRFTV